MNGHRAHKANMDYFALVAKQEQQTGLLKSLDLKNLKFQTTTVYQSIQTKRGVERGGMATTLRWGSRITHSSLS